jgi:hypothetical protein
VITIPDIPDFTMKQSFPISSAIDAAQRNAVLQQQSREAGNQSLVAGLQSIGQIGQSLFDTKKRVARSLALGRQYDIADDVSKTMDPEDIIKVGDRIDMSLLLNMMHPGSGGTPQVATGSPAPNSAATPSQNSSGAVLASNTTATPLPVTPNQTPDQSMTPSPVAPVASPAPVPIPAPAVKHKTVNKATFNAAIKLANQNRPENVMTGPDALAAGQVPHGTRIVNPAQGTADRKEQDAYYRDAVRGLQSIRGDQQVKDIETQRNAAISAYNRLKDIEYTGKAPNPVDYVDILGQVYKARTGQAPGEQILKDARQATSASQLGKFWTFASGQQMPGTSKEIAASLKDMVAHMGLQADDLHDGVMQAHGSMVFNPNMSQENVSKLSKVARGKSFAEATGVKPEDFDPHIQAIQWAQSHPNDPRSAPILQKAMQAKQSAGGQIGL